jgi:hypothetical protein
MRQGAGAFQFSKDCVLVREKIPDETEAIALVHCQARLLAWSKDTRGERGCEGSDIGVIRRSKLNKTSEVSCDGIEGCNVGKTKLAKC